ncbi:conserved hypothetical protein [Hirschia baltica ATCC 49814]|uniref:Transmembrane protein n=1 Tax=Hirschia baltica (strain ATCC 49814 / DSM 5838 / IFAM 1418) TaxID=582402 RepID=C6XN98_HIRBI|nr:conserved hypothetical protein [Hirschia baltica ATCC 49814]
MDDKATKSKTSSRRRDKPSDRGQGMRALFGIFPLLSIPIIIYNLLAFSRSPDDPDAVIVEGAAVALSDVPHMHAFLNAPIWKIPMVSDGAFWAVSRGDILLILGLTFLFAEVLKSTSTGAATIFNHAVSMLLFIFALVEFLLFKNFATSVFFILSLMCLLDVLAGVVVTIVSARRDFAVGEGFGK